jgi:hypothetical protein
MSLPARLQAASSEYQKLQVDLSNAVEARQRLDAQLSENELVKKVREPKLIFFSVRCSHKISNHRRCLMTTATAGVYHVDAEQSRIQTGGTSIGQTGSGGSEEQCRQTT